MAIRVAGDIKAPSIIANVVVDIVLLASDFNNVKFVYRNRFANKLVDVVAKRSSPSLYFPNCFYS